MFCVLSRLTHPGCLPGPVVLSKWPCRRCPIPTVLPSPCPVLASLTCLCCPFLAILSSVSFPGCTIPAVFYGFPVLSQQSCPHLSWRCCPCPGVSSLFCPGCPVLDTISRLSCHGCPILIALSLLSCSGHQSSVFFPGCTVPTVVSGYPNLSVLS